MRMFDLKNKVGIYFEVLGLAVDRETGENDYAGVKLELDGDFNDPNKKCEELFNSFSKNDEKKRVLLKLCHLDLFDVNDIVIITKEEYYKKYGNDEENENA